MYWPHTLLTTVLFAVLCGLAGAGSSSASLEALETQLAQIEQMQFQSSSEESLDNLRESTKDAFKLAEGILLTGAGTEDLSDQDKSRAVNLLIRLYEIAGAGTHSATETLDLQRRLLQQAWSFLEDLDRTEEDASVTVLRLLSVTSEQQGDLQAATEYLSQAIEIQRLAQVRPWSELEASWSALARIEAKRGRDAEAAKAEDHAERLRTLLESIPNN